MPAAQKIKVLGYRWVSNRGANACERCASLHGVEFYFQPKPGQNAVENMPKAPLHPNCRCTYQEIVGFETNSNLNQSPETGPTEDHSIRPYMKKVYKDPLFGMIWRVHTIFSGPIYGKYGGENWYEGRDVRDTQARPVSDLTPEDDMDAAFADHDHCYDMMDTHTCDVSLVEALEALNADPTTWLNPPGTRSEIEYAVRYRKHALSFFKARVRLQEEDGRIPVSP